MAGRGAAFDDDRKEAVSAMVSYKVGSGRRTVDDQCVDGTEVNGRMTRMRKEEMRPAPGFAQLVGAQGFSLACPVCRSTTTWQYRIAVHLCLGVGLLLDCSHRRQLAAVTPGQQRTLISSVP